MPTGKVNYQKGVIYTIRSRDSVYVGSTTNFTTRKRGHKSHLHLNTQRKLYQSIIDNDGEWEMKPYQLFPCNSKLELEIQEEKIRQILKADLNTQSCRGFDMKEYYQQNKEQIKSTANEFYHQNKEQTNKRKKEKITCECGNCVRRGDIIRHKKSNKHKLLLEQKLNTNLNSYSCNGFDKKKYMRKYRQQPHIREQTYKKKKQEKITCECGSCVRRADISRHKRTKKHMLFLEQK